MIVEEGLPPAQAIVGDRALGKVSGDGAFIGGDAKFEQFAVDSRRSLPILAGHPENQIADFLGDAWSPDLASPGFPSPDPAEALAMPGDHRIWVHDHQARGPTGPQPAQQDPESAVERADPWSSAFASEDRQLLAQGKVFDHQRGAAEDRRSQEHPEADDRGAEHGPDHQFRCGGKAIVEPPARASPVGATASIAVA